MMDPVGLASVPWLMEDTPGEKSLGASVRLDGLPGVVPVPAGVDKTGGIMAKESWNKSVLRANVKD